MELTDKLNQQYPDGITLDAGQVELDELYTYLIHPSERVFEVSMDKKQYPYHPELLDTEIRLKPQDYDLIGQDMDGRGLFVTLHDTFRLLDNMYVENVPLSTAAKVHFSNPDLTSGQFKEALQLFDLMQRGVEVLESGKMLKGSVQDHVQTLTRELQHIHTDVDTPLQEHPYYNEDIRLLYDYMLKEMAEVKLRERKVIPTVLQSFRLSFANPDGDNKPCENMARTINTRFRDNRGKLAEAVTDGSDMTLNVYTLKPRWRKEILDTVAGAWALQSMSEVTDMEQMPQAIAEWRQENNADKRLEKIISGIKDTVFFYEKGTCGFMVMDHFRNMRSYGERLSPDSLHYLNNLAEKENLQAVDGSLVFQQVGPVRTFINKRTGDRITAAEETVDGKPVLVKPYSLRPSEVQNYPQNYTEMTGLTNARVIGQGHGSAVLCDINGEHQNAERLAVVDWIRYTNGNVTAEQLACKYFASQLMEQNSIQEHNKGLKR